MCDEVREFRWKDMKTRINGSLALWRTCFQHAIGASLSVRVDLKAADFVRLRGIKHLILSACRYGGFLLYDMMFPDSSF